MEQLRYSTLTDYPDIDKECAIKHLGYHWRLDKPFFPHRPDGDRGYFFLLAESDLKIREVTILKTYKKYSFIIFAPGTYIHFGHTIPWSHSLLGIGGTYVNKLMAAYTIPCNKIMKLSNREPFYECIFGCYKELMHQGDTDVEILKSYLHIFIKKLYRSLYTTGDNNDDIPGKFIQAKRYIDERYFQKIHIGTLATMYGYSEPYFISCFTHYFHISPAAYIIRKRMDEAAVSLLNLNLKIKDIAANVGIENYHYFSRLFKKIHGVSPVEYRKNVFGHESK